MKHIYGNCQISREKLSQRLIMKETSPKFTKEFSNRDSRTRALPVISVYPQLSSSMWKCSVISVSAMSPQNPSSSALPTGTGIHRHAGVNLQHHIPACIEEKNAEGTHLLWNAARLGDARDDSHRSDDALDGGVVGRTHHLRTWVEVKRINAHRNYCQNCKEKAKNS